MAKKELFIFLNEEKKLFRYTLFRSQKLLGLIALPSSQLWSKCP